VVGLTIGSALAQQGSAPTRISDCTHRAVRTGSYAGMCYGTVDPRGDHNQAQGRSLRLADFSEKRKYPDVKVKRKITKGIWEGLLTLDRRAAASRFHWTNRLSGCARVGGVVEVQFSEGEEVSFFNEGCAPGNRWVVANMKTMSEARLPQAKLTP